jgi:hypothetical protein
MGTIRQPVPSALQQYALPWSSARPTPLFGFQYVLGRWIELGFGCQKEFYTWTTAPICSIRSHSERCDDAFS